MQNPDGTRIWSMTIKAPDGFEIPNSRKIDVTIGSTTFEGRYRSMGRDDDGWLYLDILDDVRVSVVAATGGPAFKIRQIVVLNDDVEREGWDNVIFTVWEVHETEHGYRYKCRQPGWAGLSGPEDIFNESELKAWP